MMPHADDGPALVKLKLDLWNMRAYLDKPLSRENFEQASTALADIWRRWALLEQERS